MKQHFHCNVCQSDFDVPAVEFLNHLKTHTRTQSKTNTDITTEESKRHQYEFRCDICDMVFRSKGNLNAHELNYHMNQGNKIEVIKEDNSIKEFKCSFCDKTLTTKLGIKRHVKSEHENANSVKCDFCEKEFKTIGTLRDHKRARNKTPQICKKIDLDFKLAMRTCQL